MSFYFGFDPFGQSGDSTASGGATPAIGISPTGQTPTGPFGGAPLAVAGGLGAAGTAGFESGGASSFTPGGMFPGSNMIGMNKGQPVFGNPLMSSFNPLSLLSNAGSLFGSQGGGFLGSLLGGVGQGFAGAQLGSLGADLLASLFGLNSSSAGNLGGEIGGGVGTIGGMLLAPFLGPEAPFFGAAGGDLLGSLLGDLFGGGLPRMAKPDAYEQALLASNDPNQIALAEYLQSGYNRGYDLSEPLGTPFNPWLFGDITELATRRQFPLNAQGELSYNLGFQHPVGLDFATLRELLTAHPGFPEITSRQLLSVEPELGLIANVPTQRAGSPPAAWSQAAKLFNELNAAESY
jgi:hypothetical protein